jgi:uncharacterized protein (TIGR00730 family)
MNINNVAVFCGSQNGTETHFKTTAFGVGETLAQLNKTLIYGGGGRGLMGAVADGALSKNGNVIGIMPNFLINDEHKHLGVKEFIKVPSMHERKQLIYQKCDAAIILPGGFGTMDELFEMLTWNQLGLHKKTIIIFNEKGFYNYLLFHIKNMEATGFIYKNNASNVEVVESLEALKVLL